MLDWLIVGGGIHGTALSYHLKKHGGVPSHRLRVLDAEAEPLARWRANTANVGMRYLRSPGVHHLHGDPFSLRTFANTRAGLPHAQSISLYERPSLALFNRHSEWVIDHFGLGELRSHGRAHALTKMRDGWRVESENGALEARRVVLALGVSDQPFMPDWAKSAGKGSPIFHIFDHPFNLSHLSPYEHVAIAGGGISAAQAALALARAGKTVTLFMRHPIRLSHFDSDPCWVTSLCRNALDLESDLSRRRAMIRHARQRGSLPPDVELALQEAVASGSVRLLFSEIVNFERDEASLLRLVTSDNHVYSVDALLLATGFRTERPGGAWIDDAIGAYDLPIAHDGYPIPDRCLEWQDRLYVTGALAELEIGPVARNIIGARLSGERLAHVARAVSTV